MNDAVDEYLIDLSGQDREKEAVRQFCATPFQVIRGLAIQHFHSNEQRW